MIIKINEKFVYNITFIHRSARWKYFFGMTEGGGSDLQQLLKFFTKAENHIYMDYISYFNSIIPTPPKKPVIFLLDNEFNSKKPLHQFINKLSKANNLESNIIKKRFMENIYIILP